MRSATKRNKPRKYERTVVDAISQCLTALYDSVLQLCMTPECLTKSYDSVLQSCMTVSYKVVRHKGVMYTEL